MADFRPMIAERLRDGARWATSFHRIRVHLDRMIQDGEIERVKPDGGMARNMVALTEKGRKRYLIANMKRKTIAMPTEVNEN